MLQPPVWDYIAEEHIVPGDEIINISLRNILKTDVHDYWI
jgi:hypothetical protein